MRRYAHVCWYRWPLGDAIMHTTLRAAQFTFHARRTMHRASGPTIVCHLCWTAAQKRELEIRLEQWLLCYAALRAMCENSQRFQ
jgi:hypothetical protein